MKTKYNFITCGYNIRIFDLFKINSSKFICVIFNFSNGSSLCNCGLHLQFSSTFQIEIRDLTELLFKVILNVGSPYSWGVLNIYSFLPNKMYIILLSRIISVLTWLVVNMYFASMQGDLDSIPGLGSSPWEGKGYPLQYSGLENSMNCVVHGCKELDTTEQLSLSLNIKHEQIINLVNYFCL